MLGKRLWRGVAAGVLVLLIVWATNSEWIQELGSVEGARTYVQSFGVAGPAVFVGIYVLLTVLFVPATPLTLVGGALFGPWWGTGLVLMGAFTGAALAFLLARYVGQGWARSLLTDRFARVRRYDEELEKHGLATILFLRLVPLFPFNALNFLLGVTRVKTSDYMWGTLVGIIPGTFVYAYLGASLVALSWWQVGLAVVLLLVLVGGSVVGKRLQRKLGEREFDVIVIGAGAAGLNVAGFMNRAGFKVLVIDKDEASIGGDCLNYGCVPSKALLHASGVVQRAREAEQFGVSTEGAVDWLAVRDYVRSRQAVFREQENAAYFREQGMTVVLGEARFSGPQSVRVGEQEFWGRKLVIATGSRPRRPSIPGIEQVTMVTNEEIFEMERIPERLLVVGAGAIGMEMAQAWQRLGSQVTVVDQAEQVLRREDGRIAAVAQARLESEGVRFRLGRSVKRFIDAGTAELEDSSGKQEQVVFDVVLVAVGREVSVKELAVERAGIEVDERGRLRLNKYLQTTNRRVLACGDVAGDQQFTHAAEAQAGAIARNFFAPWRKRWQGGDVPWVTFTEPEVATFGWSEAQLREQGEDYTVVWQDFEEDDRAIVASYQYGLMKLLVSSRGVILGGSIVAPGAGEMAQELILAVREEIPMKTLFAKAYPYPTAGRIVRRAAGRLLSGKLTGRAKTLLRALYH